MINLIKYEDFVNENNVQPFLGQRTGVIREFRKAVDDLNRKTGRNVRFETHNNVLQVAFGNADLDVLDEYVSRLTKVESVRLYSKTEDEITFKIDDEPSHTDQNSDR